ncbi:MAG: cytidine deaminase [Chloroflexota bacterium]
MANLRDEDRRMLIELAGEARRKAYAPYSKYPVGSAVLTKSGKFYTGCNIENAAHPTGMCAERVAIFKAVSDGEREFEAAIVLTSNGGSPCGGCRQVMAEFGLDTIVLIANEAGVLLSESSVAELLPGAFTPQKLER